MKFLFITHNTSLSGAPKTMLFFLHELKNEGHEFDVIALDGGALESQFSSVASAFFSVNSFSKRINYDLKSRIYKKLFNKKFESEYTNFVNKISSRHYDFIYVNTIVSLNLGIQLRKLMGVKLLLHLHELSTVIDEYVPDLKDKDLYVDQYIVPSTLNKKCLIDDFRIDENKIEVVESVSEIDFSATNSKKQTNEFSVLMTGGAYWRKGDDLFIQIAKKVNSINSTIKFYWVGYSSEERKRVNQYDIKKTNLTDTVFFKP